MKIFAPRAITDPADLSRALSRLMTANTRPVRILLRQRSYWIGRSQASQPLNADAELICPLPLFRQVLRQMQLQVTAELETGSTSRLFELQSPSPSTPSPLVYARCVLGEDHCLLDGVAYAVNRGNWAFYVPALEIKILHARHGARWCLHESRPSAQLLSSGPGHQQLGPYVLDDWRRALSTSILRRAAENYVSARRLSAHGVGPATGRPFLIKALSYGREAETTISAGFEVVDLTRYLKRRQTTPSDLARAGIAIDYIGSALRQQIKGYVSDFDSVRGVMPLAAEDEVRSVEERLQSLSHQP